MPTEYSDAAALAISIAQVGAHKRAQACAAQAIRAARTLQRCLVKHSSRGLPALVAAF